MGYHDYYDSELKNSQYYDSTVAEVEELRNNALKRVQEKYPHVKKVYDRYNVEDYMRRIWDYPGTWYVCFVFPDGNTSKEKQIERIVSDTIRHYGL